MPIHDWTRVTAGIFHDFHLSWVAEIKRRLNQGILPPRYYALAEQLAGGMGPDVLTLCKPVTGSMADEETSVDRKRGYRGRKVASEGSVSRTYRGRLVRKKARRLL